MSTSQVCVSTSGITFMLNFVNIYPLIQNLNGETHRHMQAVWWSHELTLSPSVEGKKTKMNQQG